MQRRGESQVRLVHSELPAVSFSFSFLRRAPSNSVPVPRDTIWPSHSPSTSKSRRSLQAANAFLSRTIPVSQHHVVAWPEFVGHSRNLSCSKSHFYDSTFPILRLHFPHNSCDLIAPFVHQTRQPQPHTPFGWRRRFGAHTNHCGS